MTELYKMNEFPKSRRIPAGGLLIVWRDTFGVTDGFLLVSFLSLVYLEHIILESSAYIVLWINRNDK